MNEIFNIKEVAKYLHCSISGIRNLVRERRIPYYRIGNRLFFKKASIDLWIDNQECTNLQDKIYKTQINPLNSEVS